MTVAGDLVDRFIDLSTGVRMHLVERAGRGTPVICLHGIWGWWRYWAPLVAPGPGSFAGRPLLMVDLRGHGASSKPREGYRWNNYASDIVALLEQEGIEHATLVGHSLGALTALLVAAAVPERIEGIVLEDPPLPVRQGGSDAFRGLYELKQAPIDEIIDTIMLWRPWISREQAAESATCLRDTADGVFLATFDADVRSIDVPVSGFSLEVQVLVIQAGDEEQRALRPAGADLLRSAFPRLRLETIAGTSHTVLRDDPGAYRTLLAQEFDGD